MDRATNLFCYTRISFWHKICGESFFLLDEGVPGGCSDATETGSFPRHSWLRLERAVSGKLCNCSMTGSLESQENLKLHQVSPICALCMIMSEARDIPFSPPSFPYLIRN